jgi:hypothetical protein
VAEWKPIEAALREPRVTVNRETVFVARFGKDESPAFNALVYDVRAGGDEYPWRFVDGAGGFHKDWPTHWMLAADAASPPT